MPAFQINNINEINLKSDKKNAFGHFSVKLCYYCCKRGLNSSGLIHWKKGCSVELLLLSGRFIGGIIIGSFRVDSKVLRLFVIGIREEFPPVKHNLNRS